MIEVRDKRCLLALTEAEVLSLLPHDKDIWARALERGKAITRARRRDERQDAIRRRRGGEQA